MEGLTSEEKKKIIQKMVISIALLLITMIIGILLFI